MKPLHPQFAFDKPNNLLRPIHCVECFPLVKYYISFCKYIALGDLLTTQRFTRKLKFVKSKLIQEQGQ